MPKLTKGEIPRNSAVFSSGCNSYLETDFILGINQKLNQFFRKYRNRRLSILLHRRIYKLSKEGVNYLKSKDRLMKSYLVNKISNSTFRSPDVFGFFEFTLWFGKINSFFVKFTFWFADINGFYFVFLKSTLWFVEITEFHY